MDMFTWKNCSIRPMLFSKREKPYGLFFVREGCELTGNLLLSCAGAMMAQGHTQEKEQ